jgi:P-type Cu+ transporter
MTQQILQVQGMHCASCASVITKKLSALPHIHTVSVNYGNEKANIDFDETKISLEEMNQEIGKFGYTFILPEKQGGSQHNHADTK